MANTNAPFGFEPLKPRTDGDPTTYRGVALATYATALFHGDPIKTGTGGLEKCATNDNTLGIIAAIRDGTAGTVGLEEVYGAASTRRIIDYWRATDWVWRVQVNADGGTTVGATYKMDVTGSGDTATGLSAVSLDQSETHASTYAFKVLAVEGNFEKRAANASGAYEVVHGVFVLTETS